MRYRGQAYELPVPVDLTGVDTGQLIGRFHQLHHDRYGTSRPGDAVQVVTYRLRATHPVPDVAIPPPDPSGVPLVEQSEVVLGGQRVSIPFYARGSLPIGFAAAGPCVLEETTATTLVSRGWSFQVDAHGCLDVRRE
jgi:N-methylhydantoinase A